MNIDLFQLRSQEIGYADLQGSVMFQADHCCFWVSLVVGQCVGEVEKEYSKETTYFWNEANWLVLIQDSISGKAAAYISPVENICHKGGLAKCAYLAVPLSCISLLHSPLP